MDDPAIQKRVARGVAWTGLATAMVAICDLVAFLVIINHWVTTEDLGNVTTAVTLFGALQLAVEVGLPAAVVLRPQRDDERRLSTVFWLEVAFGIAAYAIVWAIAPVVAGAYAEPILAPLYRIVGLLLVIRPIYTTHQALLRGELRFAELSKVRIVANVIELVVKIGSAAWLGLWCFAIAPVARELTYAIGVPLVAGWRPRWVLDVRRVAADFRFGMRASGSELVFQLYSNADYQVIQLFYGAYAVGLYRTAYELVLEPVRFVSGVVTVVAFPTFRHLAGKRAALIDQLVAFTRQNLVVVLLFVGVVLVSADDLLAALLRPEYAAAATAARILAIVGVLRAVSLLGPPLLDGLGRPDRSLRYQLVAATTLGTLFVACAAIGDSYVAVAVAWAIGYPVAFAVLARMVLAELELRAAEYLRRVARIALLIAVAVACGLVARFAAGALEPLPRLIVSSTAVVGVGLALLGRFEGFSPRAIARSFRR